MIDNKIEMIGNVRLNLSYYGGEDVYSDGTIEDDILKIVSDNENLLDVLINDNRWAVLYHLSPIRENLLEWYEFDKRGSLLEVGAGCGALTGLFCRKTGWVDAVDLSKKRSTINAIRNKDYDNLEIYVGNFEDIVFEKKYDFITLIGVFEYSVYYINSDNPFEKMLEKIKSLLKPNGKLILAIENKFGLKYWNGATEDHTGGIFDGLRDYLLVDRVRTFSKKEISDLLEKAGFKHNDYYYPIPDYKLPGAIYSDEYLPQKGDLRGTNISYDRERYELFEEDIAYDEICEDKRFPEFANSFLVISSL